MFLLELQSLMDIYNDRAAPSVTIYYIEPDCLINAFIVLLLIGVIIALCVFPPRKMFNITIENSTGASSPWGVERQPYWSSFELFPDWKGSHMYAFKGSAYYGQRYWTRQAVVVKTLRATNATAQNWRSYRLAAQEARKISSTFNKSLAAQGGSVKLVFLEPAIAEMDKISDLMPLTRLVFGFSKNFRAGESVVFEKRMEGDFMTFISDKGDRCVNGTGVLEAFCHFSFHYTDGQLLLCNLKGVFDGQRYILTSPVIHSQHRQYGERDRGSEGIEEFFKHHTCTGICSGFKKNSISKTDRQSTEDYQLEPSAPFQTTAYDVDDTSMKYTEYLISTGFEEGTRPLQSTKDNLFDPHSPIYPPTYEDVLKQKSVSTS